MDKVFIGLCALSVILALAGTVTLLYATIIIDREVRFSWFIEWNNWFIGFWFIEGQHQNHINFAFLPLQIGISYRSKK